MRQRNEEMLTGTDSKTEEMHKKVLDMPITSDKCETAGKYRGSMYSLDQNRNKTYIEGETFQQCPKCKSTVEWVLLSTSSAQTTTSWC